MAFKILQNYNKTAKSLHGSLYIYHSTFCRFSGTLSRLNILRWPELCTVYICIYKSNFFFVLTCQAACKRKPFNLFSTFGPIFSSLLNSYNILRFIFSNTSIEIINILWNNCHFLTLIFLCPSNRSVQYRVTE